MLSIKRFNGTKVKLKGYLIQMTLKLRYKKNKIETAADAVAYTGLFLTKWVLEWFKPYMTKYYKNGAITTHLETKYIFAE